MRELSMHEVNQVSGGGDEKQSKGTETDYERHMAYGTNWMSGYEGAGAIMATVGFGSIFTPIGPITAGIAIGSVAGLAISQLWADYM